MGTKKTGQALRTALMVERFKMEGIVRKNIFIPLEDWPEVQADVNARRKRYLEARQEKAHERKGQ